MMQALSFGSAIARIAESKEHSHRSEKVKAQNNAHDEDRKQRFSKEPHGGLLAL